MRTKVKGNLTGGICAVAFLAFSLAGAGVEAPTSKTQIPPQPLLRPEKL
jgi:hypothetical protein